MGREVKITANIDDDVFAAGRFISMEGGKAHTFIAAAQRLEIKNSTVRDLIAFELDIEIQNEIEDDLVASLCPICWWYSGKLLIGKNAKTGDD